MPLVPKVTICDYWPDLKTLICKKSVEFIFQLLKSSGLVGERMQILKRNVSVRAKIGMLLVRRLRDGPV